MGTRSGKSNTAEDKTVEQAYQKYKQLKQTVKEWQQEDNSYWLKDLKLADTPPYISVKNLPLAAVTQLWQRLNTFSNLNISTSKLEEIWKQVEKNEKVTDEIDEGVLLNLQLAINGVAGLAGQIVAEKNLLELETGNHHNNAVCPVCGELSSIVVLKAPNGNRVVHCNTCNLEWPSKRIGCIYCNETEPKKQMYLKNDAFPGIEVVACKSCGNYFKEIDARELVVEDYIWEDLRTIPLNYATELWLKEHVPIKMA